MKFERFDKRHLTPPGDPFLTLQKGGPFSMNRAAFEALGSPEAVELLFDREAQAIGMKPAPLKELYSYPVHRTGRPGRRPTNFVVAGHAFVRYYNIDNTISRRYPAELRDGVLVADLKQGGIDATAPPRASKGDEGSRA